MKKNLFWIFSLCFMMICLSSCNFGGNENHTHTGGVATCQSPAVCADCGQTYGTVTGHNYGDWVVTKKATLEAAGVRTKSCDYCEDKINESYSFENNQNAGIDAIDIDVLGDIYSFSVSYESDYVTLSIISDSEIYLDSFEVYFSGYGSNELIEGQAYKLVFSLDDYDFGEHLYLYSNMEFKTLISSNFEYDFGDQYFEFQIPYQTIGVNYDDCKGNFAFLPILKYADEEYHYEGNPYMVGKYAETWFTVNESNNIYYDEYYSTYSTRYEGNWERPSFKNHDSMFVGVIKESTVEEAIVAMAVAEQKGAMGFDLHLNYLYNNNLLSVENIKKITRSSKLPILALNYNTDLVHEDRLAGLTLAVDGGVAAVDFQGFIYWSGSTLNTQTADNVKYWEDQGFDMSFVKASPKETVLDPAIVAKQVEYINSIHNKGAEVLLSAHVNTSFTAEQALAFAEWNSAKGVDIVKIVGIGNSKIDVLECVEACKLFQVSEKLIANQTKVSFHLSGSAGVYITRILCTAFYKSYIAFCWPEKTIGQDLNQLDLDMAVECYNIGKGYNDDITITEAIELLKENCNHEQLNYLIENYNKLSSSLGYAYGASSDLSGRWTLSDDSYYIQLRDAVGTNSFNIRAFAYDTNYYSEDLWISSTITGNFSAFASSATASTVRVPKVGVYIGDKANMLAFVYNTNTNTIDLVKVKDGYEFSFDSSPVGDRLVSTGLITNKQFTSNVSNGTVKMAIHKTSTAIELYFADGLNAEWVKVAEITLTSEILGYFTNNNGKCYGGVLAELYMGSSSKGKINDITYKVSYDKISL